MVSVAHVLGFISQNIEYMSVSCLILHVNLTEPQDVQLSD